MTNLSPAAQSVLKLNDQMDDQWQEFLSHCLRAQAIAEREGYEFPYYLDDKAKELKLRWFAANIRAVVATALPRNAWGMADRQELRSYMLSIAYELERTE